MAQSIKLLEVSALNVGESRCVEASGRQFGVFHQPNGFFVIDNVCPHRGAPLTDGFVQDGVVVCPWHQWEFQLKDGACVSIPAQKVDSFPAEIREGAVWVEVA